MTNDITQALDMKAGPMHGGSVNLTVTLKPLHRHPILRWRGLRSTAKNLGASRLDTARVWLRGLEGLR